MDLILPSIASCNGSLNYLQSHNFTETLRCWTWTQRTSKWFKEFIMSICTSCTCANTNSFFFSGKKPPWIYIFVEIIKKLGSILLSHLVWDEALLVINELCVEKTDAVWVSFNISRPHSLSMLHYYANYCVDLIFTFFSVFFFFV